MYSGKADYRAIGAIREKVTIPILANGDVFSGADAARILEVTGASGLLVGRGAIGNPQIFREILPILSGREACPPVGYSEKLDTALEHTRLKIRYEGEKIGVVRMRTHLGHYVSGLRGAVSLRRDLCEVSTFQDVERLIEKLRKELSSGEMIQ